MARLAGRDPLDPHEHAAASQLVATCPDCARLASDIVAISRAVAFEPVPRRRRDFRISPEQARELRGSPLKRLMRRFTLPSNGGALRPLATGALSIGLVLLFVGSVVPRPSSVGPFAPAAQPETVRAVPPAPSAAAAKVGELPSREPEQRDTIGGAESMAMEMSAPDEAAASPDAAGMSAPAMDAAVPDVASAAAERAVSRPSPAPAAAPLADAQDDASPGGLVAEDAVVQDVDGLRADEGAVDEEATASANGAVVDTGSASSGIDLGTILIVTGAALVAVGIVLTLLLLLPRLRGEAGRP